MEKKSVSTVAYMKHLFEDSLVTSLPQIVTAVSKPRKAIKIVVLSVCIIGFIYQTSEFMNIYWNYPTVLDLDVEYPAIIESPSITYCNMNGVKRISFCDNNPMLCQPPKDRKLFCQNFPNFCLQNGTEDLRFPVGDALNFEQFITPEQLRKLGHGSQETMNYCKQLSLSGKYADCTRANEIHMTVSDGNTGYRNCYTLYSNVKSSILNQFQLPVPKAKEPLFHFVLKFQQEQYFRPDRQVGGIIGIHSPNVVINAFFNGFVVRPGRLYTVHLKAVEEKLLPSPYDTKCKDYKTIWQARGGKGPLSQEMCVAECIFNTSMQQCNCSIPDILYPHNERICSEDELDCLNLDLPHCYNACPQPCDFTDFEYDVRERKMEGGHYEDVEGFYEAKKSTETQAAVLIYLKRPEIIVYSHRPQYEQIEVFSFLGGYMGMWLGISLVHAFDFLESIVLITNHWIRRRIRQSRSMRS